MDSFIGPSEVQKVMQDIISFKKNSTVPEKEQIRILQLLEDYYRMRNMNDLDVVLSNLIKSVLEKDYDVKDNRAVFPIIHEGSIVDAVGRSLRNSLPKWKKYGTSGLPFSYGLGKVAVVVEDCISASVVGRDEFVGVAVLGTSLSESHKKYLSQFSTVIVALAPDALPKTVAFSKELRGHVNDVKVLRLTDDLKYRNETDINNLKRMGDTACN